MVVDILLAPLLRPVEVEDGNVPRRVLGHADDEELLPGIEAPARVLPGDGLADPPLESAVADRHAVAPPMLAEHRELAWRFDRRLVAVDEDRDELPFPREPPDAREGVQEEERGR